MEKKLCVHYIDDSESSLPSKIPQSYLDLRYVFIVYKDGKSLINGVNPVIRKFFLDLHFSPSAFEDLFNTKPEFFHKAGYGMFFEKYLKDILWNSTNKEIILENKDKISLNFQNVFFRSFEEQHPNNIKYLEGAYEVYARILMTPKTDYFPLFDLIEINFENKIVKFISVKTKPNRKIKDKEDLNFLLRPLKKLSANTTENKIVKALQNLKGDDKLSVENIKI